MHGVAEKLLLRIFPFPSEALHIPSSILQSRFPADKKAVVPDILHSSPYCGSTAYPGGSHHIYSDSAKTNPFLQFHSSEIIHRSHSHGYNTQPASLPPLIFQNAVDG